MRYFLARNISTGYGNRRVLTDISLSVDKGTTLLIIGANASGKSTLLKALYGVLPLWKGQSGAYGDIFLDQVNITEYSIRRKLRMGICYIPQENSLFEEMTVRENLELAALHSLTRKARKSKMQEVVELLQNLKTLMNSECFKLSGGERKTVNLAMALMTDADLLLLDEPIAGIGEQETGSLIDLFLYLKQQGKSLIIAEHRIQELFHLADCIVGMKLGNIHSANITSIQEAREVLL